jgi:UDP-GlcNAc:undecaprenyl-phosphate GlcNAc-1-phosphate transferase
MATVFVLGLSTSYVLVGLAGRAGARLGFVDKPRAGEVQHRAVPRSGGYGMLLALWLALAASVLLRPAEVPANPEDDLKLAGMLLGSALILPLALLDDRYRLGPVPQLVSQLGLAAVAVAFGIRLGSLASPFGPALPLPEWLDLVLSLLWIVAMINAMNLIDVMDGLAAGIAAMAALVLFTRSLWFDQLSIAVLPLALAACALGFLPRNFHPARLFMGTSGSVMLGYALACMSVIGGAKVGTAFAVLGVPILDTAWVIIRRLAKGRSPFKGGDAEHLPQRLHRLGLSQRKIVLGLYAISGIFGWLSLSLHSPPEGPGPEKLYLMLGIVLTMAAVLLGVTLMSVRAEAKRRSAQEATVSKDAFSIRD